MASQLWVNKDSFRPLQVARRTTSVGNLKSLYFPKLCVNEESFRREANMWINKIVSKSPHNATKLPILVSSPKTAVQI